MRRFGTWMAAAVLAVTAGCGKDTAGGGITPTGPSFVGQTSSVTVNCPTQMETGTSGTCTAYGYDSNGSYTNSSVTSWSSSNTAVATITSGGAISAVAAGTTTITAVIDGISGMRSVTVVTPSPLSVTMSGPSTVKPNVQCYWWADATGGTPAYHSWSWTGGLSGSAWNWEYYATSPSSGSFTVTVSVRDQTGAIATASKLVTVSSLAKVCPV
jgi:trimeric autotransporter adhesin